MKTYQFTELEAQRLQQALAAKIVGQPTDPKKQSKELRGIIRLANNLAKQRRDTSVVFKH